MKRVFLTGGSLFLAAQMAIWAAPRRAPAPDSAFTVMTDGVVRTGFQTTKLESGEAVSLSDVQQIFGGRRRWHRVAHKVNYHITSHTSEFTLNETTAMIDDKKVELPAAPEWSDGDMQLPLALLTMPEFQDMTEGTIRWDAPNRILLVEPIPEVASPQFFSYPEKSRIIVEISSRVNHKILRQTDREVAVRFTGGTSRGSERLQVQDGLVDEVSLEAHGHSCDFTVALSSNAQPPQITWRTGPRRLIVEIYPKHLPPLDFVGAPPAFNPVFPAPSPVPIPALPKPQIYEATAPSAASSPLSLSPVKIVVIDPGHGGKDAGAIGPHGTLEKDMNLEIAKELAQVFKKEGRYKVILTRNSDDFIALQERTAIANKNKADLFISIHCNAALTRNKKGFEVFFLSDRSTDEAAAAVARRENAVVELEGISGKAQEKLQQLLWSLAKTETMNESSEAAALVAREVKRRVEIDNRGVKQAGFYVLKGANMPAVLVESGFISHPKEEGVLRSGRFQKKLADALYAGVLEYEKRKIQALVSKTPAGGKL